MSVRMWEKWREREQRTVWYKSIGKGFNRSMVRSWRTKLQSNKMKEQFDRVKKSWRKCLMCTIRDSGKLATWPVMNSHLRTFHIFPIFITWWLLLLMPTRLICLLLRQETMCQGGGRKYPHVSHGKRSSICTQNLDSLITFTHSEHW